MGIAVSVLLNQSQDNFMGYQPGAPLTEAVRFELPEELVSDVSDGIPSRALELVFRELNIDVPSQVWATQYRANRHRSLSVGDVVVLGDLAYAVAGLGWNNVALQAGQITRLDNVSVI